jgi:cAMP-dependent protein kinase regulator/CRP/FNR family cyclic AMP-dependent transcriptional regulator/cGMP-dependent protein kinase 2
LFADCTFDELARVDRLGAPIYVPPGRVLTREGAAARECFVTLEGTAVAQRAGRLIGIIEAGSIAGEQALLDHTTRSATVVANSRMRLLVLDLREFAELLEAAPRVAAAVERIARGRRANSGSAGQNGGQPAVSDAAAQTGFGPVLPP